MTQYPPKQAFSVQTTCNISNFAQTITHLLKPLGLERPPADLVEPINITGLPTPLLGTTESLTISDNPSVYDWFENLWRNFAYTPLSKLCGIPGISLPMTMQENGLPLGIHAQTRQAYDGLLLQLAVQIERALGGNWNDGRRPGVHVAQGT